MSGTLRMKAGDLLPPLVIDLTDNDVALDITTATAVHVVGEKGGAALFDDAAPTRNNAAGIVTHQWVSPQTATAGDVWVEVVLTWPGGKTQTFPTTGQLRVAIEP